ncbi:hypothetical protein DSO57_1015696 [Entomophthora muscae]|uniref:Uncharacterized protein n=1 Tax=Entomophthora muscae TaxID=34485 RepID=A0ACC2RJZ9_9FUNG|nr:hypothetical protein DSO57_1015696 [Entomophthora muscae]
MFFVPLLATIFLAMVPDKSELYKGSCIIDATNDLFDENHMLRLVNAERKKTAAQCHSAYQARNKHMSHDGFKRSSVGLRVEKKGYFYSSCAENVAKGQKSVEEVVNSWMKSPGHKTNILNPDYTEFGAGMVNNYWTQNFGKHQ